MTRCSAAALAALAVAAGCASHPDHGGASPRPTAVEPAVSYATAPVGVIIRGDGFALRAYQDDGSPRLASTFRAWVGAVELSGVAWESPASLRAQVPAGLPPGAYDVVVEDPYGRRGALAGGYRVVAGAPLRLSATADVTPPVVLEGQPLTVTVIVRNDGDAPVPSVVPEFAVTGGGAVTPSATPAPQALAAHASSSFTVPFLATTVGTAWIDLSVAAFDPILGTTVHMDPQLAGTVGVLSDAPTVGATLLASAPTIFVAVAGQTVHFDVVYVNTAGEDVTALAPKVTTIGGSIEVLLGPTPPPCAVPLGGTCTASFDVTTIGVGAATLVVNASGRTASGAEVAAPAVGVSIRTLAPIQLVAQLLATPAQVAVGEAITVTLRVRNSGDLPALNVVANILAAPIGALPGPDPAPQDIGPGATVDFVWSVVPQRSGTGAFVAAAAGVDDAGAAVTLSPVASGSISVQ